MEEKTQPPAPTRLQFTGSALGLLGWFLLAFIGSMLIIPAGWVAAAFYRWFVDHIKTSDDSELSFEGRGGEIWWAFALAQILAFLPQVQHLVEGDEAKFTVAIALPWLLMPLSVACWWMVMRWFFARLRSTSQLKFTGSYLGYLGWTALLAISVYSIVGWAWVLSAMARWICRHIVGGRRKAVFVGDGAEILWRHIVALIACLFIIPIPWVLAWIYRWWVSQIQLVPRTEELFN